MMTRYGRSNGCTFYVPENQLYQDYLLKVFNGPDGPWERALASFSMCRMIGFKKVEHEIYQQKQLVALNLSSSSSKERDDSLMGKVLLVRKTEPIPLTFIGIGQMDVEIFQNEEMILAESAQEVLRELSLKTGSDLSGFLELMMAKTAIVHLQARDYLAVRKLMLDAVVLNFGIGRDEETGKPVPLWTGSGVSPKTAVIMDGNEEMKDIRKFTKLVLPESLYAREFGEEKA